MILDLGCGTVTQACELAKRVAPRSKVIGLDTSEAMVAGASKRAHNLGLELEFQAANLNGIQVYPWVYISVVSTKGSIKWSFERTLEKAVAAKVISKDER